MSVARVDGVALACASVASIVSFFLLRDVIRPLPPGILQVPRLKVITAATFSGEDRFAFMRKTAQLAAGRPVTYYAMWLQRIVISDPVDLEYVLASRSENFVKGTGFELLQRILGNGLVTIYDDQVHSKHRRLVSPAFSPISLSRISNDTMREHANELVQTISAAIQSNPVVVIGDHVHLTALNIIAEAAFHTGKSETAEVSSYFTAILNTMWNPFHLTSIGRMLSPKLRAADAVKKKIDKFVVATAQRIKDEGEVITEGSGRAIIDYLLQSGGELTIENIRDHSVTFMFAGFETSSNSVQWTLALLANNPSVQQKLFDELSTVMGRGTTPEVEALRSCAFLDAVIREGLRLFPVASLVPRVCVEYDVLPKSKVVIPAGSTVLCSILGVHMSKVVYGEDAAEYRPDRWLDAAVRDRAEQNGFIPFSIGKRNCIGKEFAWNEMTILLAVIVRNFSFAFAEGQTFPAAGSSLLYSPSRYRLAMAVRAD